METETIKRGDIFFADLNMGVSSKIGSEQTGKRPFLITSNEKANTYGTVIIGIPITSKLNKTNLPTHVEIQSNEETGLKVDSLVLAEQIRTISKKRLIGNKIGHLDKFSMAKVDKAIKIANGLNEGEWNKQKLLLKSDIRSLDKFICLCINKGFSLLEIKSELTEIKLKVLELNKIYNEYIELNYKNLLKQNKIMAM